MQIPKVPRPTPTRQELEESWRLRLEETLERYHAATEEYRTLLQEKPEGLPQNWDDLARALQAESNALDEYTRVLKVFIDLTVKDKLPEEESAPSSELG